ncbi:ADP-ribosylglycohydrolase family protein [Methylobacter sp. YRD-M1]|uniref:ADP-ribosylglycohydrolase family protein n=1 Tax=Methylobacter sp. YRD-M1 TaxID=2911520 RepID=UPI00227AA7ED|nr:ADP-ribosylglycohydrolase family protein [Methylobacter sp. YRD-M1]WAK01034.1 ADP-ribosylglycohydrolase family protein [Methylobacter sp. YRD-M1]
MKHPWLWWKKEDLRIERQQLIDEGRDISRVESEFTRLLAEDMLEDAQFQRAVNDLLDKTRLLPVHLDYHYIEPSDLEAIRAQRPTGPRVLPVTDPEALRRSRIAGAWLGRCAGCLLGEPIEGVIRPDLLRLLDRAGYNEIPDYLWRLPGLTENDYLELGFGKLLSFRKIDHIPQNDDTDYTVTAMALVKRKGINFTPSDMADFWMQNLPILSTCTAERVAYRNFATNIEPPDSAIVRNPYREWIGARIRADFFGYVALGQPELAAELAWRDASISHVKNGIYGAMWVAAMLAAAINHTNVKRVIEIGLSEIPEKSRFFEAVTEILDRHAAGATYTETVEHIHQCWDEKNPHDWCHSLSNAQIVAMGLLYGEGDYEKAITRTVLACFDTDCNGATVGSIMGMMLGADALPAKWTGVMHDTIHTSLRGYLTASISTIAEEMFQIHNTIANGHL